MSANNTNVNERSREGEDEVPDEVLDLPTSVHKANWRDDIDDGAVDEIKEVTSFEPFENEQDYQSHEIITPEAENLIDAFSKTRLRQDGQKVMAFRFRKAA